MSATEGKLAYYLKYRPQTLDELIGQDNVKSVLKGAFQNNKLSHAYLFVGPRGTGKTSTARILAKMVNCQDKNPPCNKCEICTSITDGSNLDLIEIDAASNRGIDDIRSLRDRIKLSPTSALKKIYIIDEVHMLTQEAFNALLKTLEEPPSHALFILATTEVQKVPQTILSRVQRLDFKLATMAELNQALERIAKQEKLELDSEVVQVLVQKADGSFRDGVKLLDQVSSSGNKITLDQLKDSIRSSGFEDLIQILDSLTEKNATLALGQVNKLMENGADPKEAILSLMELLRKLVFVKNGLEQLVQPSYSDSRYQLLKPLAEKFLPEQLVSCLDLLQTALEKLKTASIPSLPLELAVVQACGFGKSSGEVKVVEKVVVQKVVEQIPVEQPKITDEKKEIEQKPEIKVKEVESVPVNPSEDMIKLKEKWNFVLETIKPYNFSLEALLRSVNITEVGEQSVVIEVPYSFHQRILEAPKNRDLLESVLSDVLSRSVRVATVLGNRPQRREDIANIEVAADDEIIRVAAEIFNSDTIN